MNDFEIVKKEYDSRAKIYHEKVQDPDDGYCNVYIERPAVRSLLGEIKNKSILDLGCGSGVLTRSLKDEGAEPCGIDLSDEMIEIAKRENPDINFIAGNGEKLPYSNDSFDIIVSSLVFHYFRDLNKVFGEANRVLKSNGTFVFSMHHPFMESLKKEYGKKRYYLTEYNNNDKYEWEMTGMKLVSHRHSVQMIFDSLVNNGFVVNRIVEPLPVENSPYPEKAKDKAYKPMFIVFKANKI